MKSSWISFAASTLLAGAAALAMPHVAIAPGPLADAHASLAHDCTACHALLRGVPRERCQGCHAQASIGVTSVAGVPMVPTHDRNFMFHHAVRAAACVACHDGHRREGRAGVRFDHALVPEALRPDCAACHAMNRPMDAFHAPLSGDCGACHVIAGWKPATFDHERHFRFDANHPARCADCHTIGGDFKRYRCTGCHEHTLEKMVAEHRSQNVENLEACARCHRTGNEHDAKREGGGDGRGKGDGDRKRHEKGKDGDD